MALRQVIKEGYLKKIYDKKLTRPKDKWFIFVLVNNQPILEVYQSRETSLTGAPSSSFNLTSANVVPLMSETTRANFVIALPHRRLTLQASQSEERDRWINSLNRIITRFGTQACVENTYGPVGVDDEYGEIEEDYGIYEDTTKGFHEDNEIEIVKAKSMASSVPVTSGSDLGACGGPVDESRHSTDSGSGGGRSVLSHPLPEVPPLPNATAKSLSSEIPQDWVDNPFVFQEPLEASATGIPPVPPRGSTPPAPLPPPRNGSTPPPVPMARPRPSRSSATLPATQGLPLPIPNDTKEEEEDVYGQMWENGTGQDSTDTNNDTSKVPTKVLENWINELDDISARVTNLDLWLKEAGIEDPEALDFLEEDVYGTLEANLEAHGRWENLNELRERRNQSVTNVFRPNPKAPDFDPKQEPLPLAGFFEKKVGIRGAGEIVDHRSVKEGMLTVRRTTSGGGSSLFITAGPDASLSALAGAVEALKKQILSPGGVVATVRVVDLQQHVAFVEVNNAVWIAGWHPKAIRLHHLIHIGDQVVGVNDMSLEIDSVKTLSRLIDSLPRLEETCQLRLRRLPYGKVLAIRRDEEGQALGIDRVGGTNEVARFSINGLVARHGLTSRCSNFDPVASKATEGRWTITEVNGRALNLFYKNNEADVPLNATGMETSLVVQPTDLIKRIAKAAKANKRYKGFVGQA